MTKVIRAQLVTLFALLTALVMTLAACGGGGSSAGSGGGSGSTIAGTVTSGVAAAPPAGAAQTVFTAAMDLLIEPASAGVGGVTVELLNAGGMVVGSQTTGPNGRFIFRGLVPGSYSIRLSQGDTPLGHTDPVQVGSNSSMELELDVNGSVLSVEIETEGDTIAGEVEDDAGSDDLASDDTSSDDDSVDDQSADLDSNDDDSADDDSTDDDDDSGATV